MSVLQVRNLRATVRTDRYSSRRRTLFDGVSFAVEPGEQVAVLGVQGTGKTTLLRLLARLDKPEAGRIHFEDTDITAWWGGRLRALRQRMQFVGGDPMRSLPPRYTLEQILLEPLRIHHRGSASEQHARAAALADRLELNPWLLGRTVSGLSATMRQRVALARALTLQPRLLVCDELTDRLEPAAARPLLSAVARACRADSEPIAWVWATTDRGAALAFADRVLRLENGQLVAD